MRAHSHYVSRTATWPASVAAILLMGWLLTGCSWLGFGDDDEPDAAEERAAQRAVPAAGLEQRLADLEARLASLEDAVRSGRAMGDTDSRLRALEDATASMMGAGGQMPGQMSGQSGAQGAAKPPQPMEYALMPTPPEGPPPSGLNPTPVAASDFEPAQAAAAPAAGSMSQAKAKQLYQQALGQLRAKRTEEARKFFNEFLGANPGHELEPNALYWLGESYYHEQRFAQAILTFKEVARRFPQHDKAAAAMLKAGFSYEKLGDMDNARFYLQTLVDEYPQSDPARMARNKLKSL